MLPSAREFYDIEGLWSKEAGELEEMVREGARELEREDWEGAVDLEKRQARRERFEKVVGKRGVGGGGKKRRGQEGGYDDYIRGGRGREVVG